MSVLDPKGDAILIEHITRSMNERGFEVREKVTEPNLLHE